MNFVWNNNISVGGGIVDAGLQPPRFSSWCPIYVDVFGSMVDLHI